jgi:hypothetical protein
LTESIALTGSPFFAREFGALFWANGCPGIFLCLMINFTCLHISQGIRSTNRAALAEKPVHSFSAAKTASSVGCP